MILSCRYWWAENSKFILRLGKFIKNSKLKLQFLIVSFNEDIFSNNSLIQSYYNNYLSDRNNIHFLDNISGIVELFKAEYEYLELKNIIKSLQMIKNNSNNNLVELIYI